MKKRLGILILIFTFLFGTMCTSEGFAAAYGSMSGGGTYAPGSTVNITISYRGDTFGVVSGTLNYDSSILEYVSASGTYNPGNRQLVMSAAGATQLSMTITFKAKNEGTTSVSLSNVEGGNINEEPFSAGASTSVTVKKADTPKPTPSTPSVPSGDTSGSSGTSGSSTPSTKPSSKPSSSDNKTESPTNGRGEFGEDVATPVEEEEESDPSEKPEYIEVIIGDKTYIIVEELKDKEMPEGFEAKKYEWGEYKWPIQIAKSENSKYTLILLQDKGTSEESWFIYNEETGEFSSSTTLSVLETIEFERLKAAPKEEESNTLFYVFIGLSVILAGSLGYLVYRFKDELLPKKTTKDK